MHVTVDLRLYFINAHWQVCKIHISLRKNETFSSHAPLIVEKLSTIYLARSYSINWEKKVFKGASYKYRFLCTRTINRRSNWQEINPILSLLLRVKAGLHRYHLGSLNCYLRDLPNLLNSTASSADITLGEKSINGLLYADDLVIFSRSAKGLQNIFLISKMESFCDFADLDVNIDKTKVNNYSFRLESVKSNRYLGLSPYGRNFKKLHSKLISPILLYWSEMWGIDCNRKI